MWWQPSNPNNIKPIPWLSPEATEYLESILTTDMEVIEHGSGGSTLFMAERVKKVTSYEVDDDWERIVKQHAPKNVRVVSRGTYKGTAKCDLLFIDGEPLADRKSWLTLASSIVNPGGWIVLDNANRPEYAAERDSLQECADLIERVDGNVQNRDVCTRFLVTEFWKVRE